LQRMRLFPGGHTGSDEQASKADVEPTRNMTTGRLRDSELEVYLTRTEPEKDKCEEEERMMEMARRW
jgi:hypothetical protein